MALSILVVDDDKIDREAVKRYLSRPGTDIVCFEAETGAEAERYMADSKYDCVFLDYHLPDIDGISLLRKFYDTETGLTPSPIVMLTGQGTEGVMIDAIRWGAQDYLVKDSLSRDAIFIALTKAREFFELKQSQHRAELLLRQSQKMDAVGQLTSGVAHDFNNLLTVILGNTRLIGKRLESDEDTDVIKEDVGKKVQAIETAARKGADLVKRLMVFTRQRPLEQQIVDINDHVREIHELLRRTLGEVIEIRTILAEDIWPVEIDPSQFENAFINMAVNSRDAMPKGGRLTIETQNVVINNEYTFSHPDVTEGEYVMLAISDTGIGMKPETAKRIFEPFFTTKAAGEGTGLGLSMVYGLVRQSGGYIHVYSEVNQGTVFRIYLPKAEISDGDGRNSVPDSELARGSETILVVEDDDEVRRIAVSMLETLGYKVLHAADGRMALEVLKREHRNIDLIFTDIVMPSGMGGIELVKKAKEYYPGIHVLYTSGYTENAIPDYQLITDTALICKPYRKEVLAGKIRQVLENKEV